MSDQLSAAELDVLAERLRQVLVDGFDAAHDDHWKRGQITQAAVCYIDGSSFRWPWAPGWWKPTSRRRNLVKAAALIIAEIERLDRKGGGE